MTKIITKKCDLKSNVWKDKNKKTKINMGYELCHVLACWHFGHKTDMTNFVISKRIKRLQKYFAQIGFHLKKFINLWDFDILAIYEQEFVTFHAYALLSSSFSMAFKEKACCGLFDVCVECQPWKWPCPNSSQ